MRIRYGGAATARMIGPYTWSAGERVQDVLDPGLVAEILTQPGEVIEVDESDPLRQALGISAEVAARLALAGVIDAPELLALDRLGVPALASEIGVSVEVVHDWQERLLGRQVNRYQVSGIIPSHTEED